MELRYYQKEAIEKALQNNNGYINLCTASGKSVVIAETCNGINAPTLILQPSVEILQQNYNKLANYQSKYDIGVYSASAGQKVIAKYTFATIGSIINEPEKFKHFKNVLIDECHLVNPKEGQYKKFIDIIQPTKLIGFTGTPFRNGSTLNYETGQYEGFVKFLHRTRPKVFDKMLYSYSAKQALADGYISPVQYETSAYKTDFLKFNSTGDYTEKSIYYNNKHNDIYTQMGMICRKLNNKPFFRGCIIFVAGVDEAKEVAELMKNAGFSVACVDGKTAKKERQQILNDFKVGKIKFVVNVGILTTGFDYPELDTIIFARPTFSLALYWQMVGRVIRIAENKPYGVVYDLCGNVARFGAMEQADFVNVNNFNTGLVCGDKVLITYKQADAIKLADIKTEGLNKVIPVGAEAKVVEKLLQNPYISKADKNKIQQKRSGTGKFAGKYLIEIPEWNVKWLSENNCQYIANNIIETKAKLQELYNRYG